MQVLRLTTLRFWGEKCSQFDYSYVCCFSWLNVTVIVSILLIFFSSFDVPNLCSSSSFVPYSPNFCVIVMLLSHKPVMFLFLFFPKLFNFHVFDSYFKYDISSCLWCDIQSSLVFFLTKCSLYYVHCSLFRF